ncbi:MAG: DUF1700 domain-containing protein [Parvularculaceae bacterium]
MSSEKRIDDYVHKLSRALSGLGEEDRREILNEIRAHLEHRAGENRLDEALKGLGAPQECARGFLDEIKLQAAFADAGPVKTLGALLALASWRATAAAGLFVSGIFFLFAVAFAIIAVTEIVSPEAVGLWIDPAQDTYVLGVVDLEPGSAMKDVLGRWMIPVASALAVFSVLVGQWLGRLFIRLMMKKPRSGAI